MFIIVILICYLLFIHNKKIEHYDDRFANYNFDKCAEFCKTTAECYGFGYDRENSVCYPSRKSISGKPANINTRFRDQYSPNNSACNKIEPIILPGNIIPFDKRRKNSIFVCSEKEGLHPQWYLHSHGNFKNIGEGNKIDDIFDIDKYSVTNHQWPLAKLNVDQLDLLVQERLKPLYTNLTVTQLDRMKEKPIEPVKSKSIGKQKQLKTEPTLDFGLENIKNYSINSINKLIRSLPEIKFKYQN